MLTTWLVDFFPLSHTPRRCWSSVLFWDGVEETSTSKPKDAGMTLLLPVFSEQLSLSKIFCFLKILSCSSTPASSGASPGTQEEGNPWSKSHHHDPARTDSANKMRLVSSGPYPAPASLGVVAGSASTETPAACAPPQGSTSLLAPRPFEAGHRGVSAHGAPHVRPLLQQLVAAQSSESRLPNRRGVFPLALCQSVQLGGNILRGPEPSIFATNRARAAGITGGKKNRPLQACAGRGEAVEDKERGLRRAGSGGQPDSAHARSGGRD